MNRILDAIGWVAFTIYLVLLGWVILWGAATIVRRSA